MHTIQCGQLRLHFNSDLSGEAILQVPATNVEDSAENGRRGVKIYAGDLLALVAELVRRQKASQLETMHWREILGLPNHEL